MLSLFSGIGAFEAALDNIGIDFELVGYCEIDKYASKSYSVIHGVPESMNYGDITKIDEKKLPKDIDLITYGFPCQDISLAGKQKGLFNEDGTQTRSGLFFEALRIIEETQPKIAIAENVKNLVGKKFKEQFEIVLSSLERAGYNNYWKVLNAKDYGIPQNRERVFIVSIRKDIDTGVFEFPEPYELKLRLKDLLEDEVDEKFYIANKQIKQLFENNMNGADIIRCGNTISGGERSEILSPDGIVSCLSATDYKQPKQILDRQPILIGGMQKNQAIKTDGVCTTLTSSMGTGGGYVPMVTEPHIVVKTNNSKGYDVAEVGDYINIERPGSTTRRGRVGHGVSQTLDTKENHCVVTTDHPIHICDLQREGYHEFSNRVYSPEGVARTLMGSGGNNNDKSGQYLMSDLRIRKLTPKECFRLMGFSDEDFEKAQSVNSNTQLYKQAGNSIVVDVLEELFCMMFDEDGNFFI